MSPDRPEAPRGTLPGAWHVLVAESIKLRRSWMLLVALLAPLAQAAFLFIVLWFSEDRVRTVGTGFQAWYQVNHAAWNTFFLPASVALMASLSWGLEADFSTWKHLLSQPVSRKAHFGAKLFNLLLLLILIQLLLAGLLLLGGLLLRAFVPALGMGSLEPLRLLRFTLLSMLGSLPLGALHVWLGSRTPRLSAALMVALGGLWIATRLGPGLLWPCLWPWGVTSRAADLAHVWTGMPWGTLLALPLTALLAWLGSLDFALRGEIRS